MKDLSIRRFSDIVWEKLKDLDYELILTNPTTENKFPLIELHTPLKSINKTVNAFPIKSTFQISITCWNEMQRATMDMTEEVSKKLQELNLTRTNTGSSIFDQILKKYGITITLEVRYNALTNSFEFIK